MPRFKMLTEIELGLKPRPFIRAGAKLGENTAGYRSGPLHRPEELVERFKVRLVKNHAKLARYIPYVHLPYRSTGGWIYLNVGESSAMLERALGHYERKKVAAIESFLKPGGTFVDVGANKGDFSLLAASLVGNSGKVLAFEPEPENCRWLRKSIRANGYDNVTLHEVALSDEEGSANLYLGDKSGWHSLLPGTRPRPAGQEESSIEISTRTLDSVLKDSGQNRVDVIKIDVEGAELNVLEGAHETLSHNKDIILLMDIHPTLGADVKAVLDLLFQLGFSVYRAETPFDKRIKAYHPGYLSEILAYRC